MAIAWNILGGFTGYVNFGSAGFFALGAYTSVALHRALEPSISCRCWSRRCSAAWSGSAPAI